MGAILPKRFEPIRFLRKDRASSTFIATDQRLGRNEVVVKVIGRGNFTSDTAMLVDVFSWYRGLRHPHISEVLDAGLTPKQDLFYVRACHPASEFFATADMDSLKALLSAVDFLYSKGRIHGAIRPSNIFGGRGKVLLTDPWIGLKRPLAEEDVRFTAPEVLAGATPSCDSDLYSLGAVLYRFFSRRDPFEDSDLESLKAKYIWAYPRPLASVSHVSKSIADNVTNLIHKDPSHRKTAFEALKEELEIQPTTATRAPAVGLSSQIEETLKLLLESRKLRVVVVEGPAGSGKSRFVEEVQSHAGFRSQDRTVVFCEATAPVPYTTLARRVVSVIDERNLSVSDPALARLRAIVDADREPASKLEQESVGRDLVNLFASLARQARLLLVIEDIDRGSRKMSSFLEAIAHHASELDLGILVTTRPFGLPGRTSRVVDDFVGENFHQLTLGPLGPAGIQTLSEFFAADPDRRSQAQQKAGGNPLFLEEYCRNPKPSVVPPRVRKTLTRMIRTLPTRARSVAETLSLLDQAVSCSVLSRIAEVAEPELRERVVYLERTGLAVSDKVTIRYLDSRPLLHLRIPKGKLTGLHSRCFRYLKEAGYHDNVLARHALRAALFDVAGQLFLQLARDRFAGREYSAAAEYYVLVNQCHAKNPVACRLNSTDAINAAHCYAHQGKRKRARTILQDLLESESVCKDAELLSRVYFTRASHYVEESPKESVRLLQLAIRCLPENSPQLLHRYIALAIALVSAGDLTASEEALKSAEAVANPEEANNLELARYGLFTHQGRFKDAVQSLLGKQFPWSPPGVIATNLSVALEQLGDIRGARDLQMKALQEGQASGSVVVQVTSLGNLGAFESKLGNYSGAEKFFGMAFAEIRALRRRNGQNRTSDLGTISADAATHFIHRGEYRRAVDRLYRTDGRCRFPYGTFLLLLARCELSLTRGRLDAARQLLESTKALSVAGDFFGVERLLMGARVEKPTSELCEILEEAVKLCVRLETRYQECRVLLALARVRFLIDHPAESNRAARIARRIARSNGYRPLAAEALLLMGLSTKRVAEKEFSLKKSLDEAAELGLTPLVAECAFRLGAWRSTCGDYRIAQDYLSQSVSITNRLAEEFGSADRKSYLSRPDHQEARNLLEEASARALVTPVKVPELLGQDSSHFIRIYRLASSMTAATDLASATATLLEALNQSLNHSMIVVLGSGSKVVCHPVRTNMSEDTRKRALRFAEHAGDKVYITGVGMNGTRDTAAWMPIQSLMFRGGIYVECLPDQPALDEREIEFLTIVTAIVGAAFDRLCGKAERATLPSSAEFCGIVGSSTAIREVRERIEVAARNAATVLIEGESGTGKELVARAIHERSSRAKASFVAVDCGALPEGLIETELFGTKKGAYTGAVADRPGLFEVADRGSIFLDEISNLGVTAQAKLLRVLQEREVRRIGSMTGRIVDVRLIAATNCNLEKLVREGKFRQDLLYRLKVLHIPLPPLRNRKIDIPALATTFLERLNVANQTKKYFGSGVLEKLVENDFPGNVRELQNVVERSFYSTTGPVIARIDFLQEERSVAETDQTESWFKDLTEGRKNFWSAIHDRYKRRDIPRESVLALVDVGLRAAHGNYKTMASMFQIPQDEYRRFMDFLRRNRCLLDFRPYRAIDDEKG